MSNQTWRHAVLLHDGTTIASFTHNQHETHVIVIESNGHTYTHVGSSGKPSRHMTPTALGSHVPAIQAMMAFRNQFILCANDVLEPSPYLHSRLLDRQPPAYHVQTSQSHGPSDSIAQARWPKRSKFTTNSLWNATTWMYEIESIDGLTVVSLHASGILAHARYPVAVPDLRVHLPMEQTFRVESTPECFTHPVAILKAARQAHRSSQLTFDVNLDMNLSEHTINLPHNNAINAHPTFRPICTNDAKPPRHQSATTTFFTVDEIVRLLRFPSTSLYEQVAVESQNNFILITMPFESPSVVVYPQSDAHVYNLLLSTKQGTSNMFRLLHGRNGSVMQQFTSATPPSRIQWKVGDNLPSSTHSTQSLLTHTTSLLNAVTKRILQVSRQTSTTPKITQLKIVEDVQTEIGLFRAFSDHRVRVIFGDRTILQLDAEANCFFTNVDGSKADCTLTSAVAEQWQYIRPALEFADWAFSTPGERFHKHVRRSENELRVSKETQRIHVYLGLNSRIKFEDDESITTKWKG